MAEFRLLGVVEIFSDGRRIPVGQPRQRLVLAALLVDAGRPVTPEALVDRVWGTMPPDGARHAIHEYLTRIRRMLAQLDGTSLTRRGGVYVLDVEPELVDLHRFRRLVERARDPGCADAARVEMLGQALDLWRGEPLADLSGEWVQRVRDSSRSQRLDAAVLRAQALIRLGRPAEVVEPLTELATENPLSEPVVAGLMQALHGTGRTVEALDCYTRIRKRLVEDLGTEPGTELQAVHRSILRGGAGPAEPEPPASVPAQLPPAVRGFAGRDAELARLDAVLADARDQGATVVICAVSGTAGVGKTALAVHWAHRIADRYPDGQLYVNLRGFDPAAEPTSPAEVVRGFLDALDVPPRRIPRGLSAQTALYRSLLAHRRILILLDNARDTGQVRPLLPGAPGCLVVVTSRSQLASLVALDGASSTQLEVLTTEESHHLLASRLGAARIAAEPEAVNEVIARCARLPLALAVVAAWAALRPTTSLAVLAHQLGDVHGRLDTLSAGDTASDVRAVFSWSYDAVSPPAAELFRQLGLHPGPDISTAAAASLAGVRPAAVARALAELVDAHLITEHVAGRYGFHDLLHAYAIEQGRRVDPEDRRRAAIHRVLDHYLHAAYAADRMLNPTRDPIALGPPRPGVTAEAVTDLAHALTWLTAEHRVLLAAVEAAAAVGFDVHTWQLASSLTTHLHRQQDGAAYAATQRVAVAASARLGDAANQVRARRSLARAYIMLSRLDEAQEQLQAALSLAVRIGDPISQAHTHNRLAYLHEAQGQHAEALDHVRQALDLFQAAGHRAGQAHALNAVGWYHALLGDHRQALDFCRQAVTLHEEVGDRDGQAAAWDSLGYAHHHLGQSQQAVTCYQRSLGLLRDLGDRYMQTVILSHLGDTHEAAGDRTAARTTYEEALYILDDLAHPDAERMRVRLSELSTT